MVYSLICKCVNYQANINGFEVNFFIPFTAKFYLSLTYMQIRNSLIVF